MPSTPSAARAAYRNLISGNNGAGIALVGASNNLIEGNYIGTTPAGTRALPNGNGVQIANSSNNMIGGLRHGERNIISGNSQDGIDIDACSDGNLIEGNHVGTARKGYTPLPNRGTGITIADSNNTIGGTTLAAENKTAFNGSNGVLIALGTGDEILDNAIFANFPLNIRLANGGNHTQAAPVLSAATSDQFQTTVGGSLTSTANTTFTLRFSSDIITVPPEGRRFLGSPAVTTDSNGNASFMVTLPVSTAPGRFITATATSPTGDTSAFSAAVAVNRANLIGSPRRGNRGGLAADADSAQLPATAAVVHLFPEPVPGFGRTHPFVASMVAGMESIGTTGPSSGTHVPAPRIRLPFVKPEDPADNLTGVLPPVEGSS